MSGPRPIWKGHLKIALVHIPIKVFLATDPSEGLKFNQLHEPCQSRVSQKRWCASCEREVPTAEIVKGFEFAKGQYVLLLDAELDAVQPDSARVIDVTEFVPVSTLPFRAIDRAYFLVPDGADDSQASRAHALMVAVLKGRVGIGTLAIYGREYLVAVGPQDGALLLYTLHPAAEWREAPMTDVRYTFSRTELALATELIAAYAAPFPLFSHTNQHQIDLQRYIDAKIAGEDYVTVPPPVVPHREFADAIAESLKLKAAKPIPSRGKRRWARDEVVKTRTSA